MTTDRATGVIVVTSGKGGVGKSTSVAALAAALTLEGNFSAEASPPDLVMDLDYGASLTRTYGYNPEAGFAAAVLNGECSVEEALHTTPDGVMLIPTDALIGDVPKSNLAAWTERLRAIGRERLVICDGSDDILSTAVAASILAADVLAIPVQLSRKAYERTWPEIFGVLQAGKHNPEIVWFGTMVDKRLRAQRETITTIARDGIELAGFIPRAASIDEADYQGRSVVSVTPNAPASLAYRDLAATIYARLRKIQGAKPSVPGRATRPLPASV